MKKLVFVSATVISLALTGCASENRGAETTTDPSAGSATTATPTGTTPPQLTESEMISQAENAVKAELPDIPIWEGTTFEGVILRDNAVCVDRTYAEGKGITDLGGSAGYVVVAFPALSLGEPQDGVCKDAPVGPSTAPEPVDVPASVSNDPNFVTRDQYGKEWPLTVEYGTVRCQEINMAGRALQVASFVDPSGKEFALNGTAKSHSNFPEIDSIWADNPSADGLKVNISPPDR